MLARAILALGLVLLPLAAAAAPTPEPAGAARNGGTIEGRLTAVDYQRGVLGVDAGARGRIAVDVMPSTAIQGTDSAYHALSDLKAGQRVQILSSVAGGTYVAQIIRILP
jgi:hypothetical protein